MCGVETQTFQTLKEKRIKKFVKEAKRVYGVWEDEKVYVDVVVKDNEVVKINEVEGMFYTKEENEDFTSWFVENSG